MYTTEKAQVLAVVDDAATLDCREVSTVGLEISGTWVGTLVFEYTIDGHTWRPLKDIATQNTQTTANGAFTFNVAPYKIIRIRFNPVTSGTPTIYMWGKEEANTSLGGGSTPASSANTPAIASAATALAANSSRKGWMIQNVGTNPLFVLLGSGASTTVFHAVLKGGTGANDGTGGSLSQMSGAVYTGIITIAGTSPSYVVTEL